MNRDRLSDAVLVALAVGLVGAAAFVSVRRPRPPAPPAPATPPARPAPLPLPQPQPKPAPCPRWPQWVRGPVGPDAIGQPRTGGPTSPDGSAQVQVDLPVSERLKNVGGRDGAGLCVFTSIAHAARWQNERRLFAFQQQMRRELGGGYPQKVDAMITKYGKGAPYLQYEGSDPSILELALKSGRMPGVTYNGHDPHYRSSIAHMVNLVYLDDKQACILDNNFINDDQLVWMTRDEFLQRWKGGRQGWAVILLSPRPPPPPRN